ncbi:DNA cytosine methyltransferase [Streptomyces jeddahensis]|uniref:Cytosine-specific methyltransferase n=1 Tax=Streptomyces jeddahensis TaxID=1716141 RepID=A0A177HT75_9ACTN|nr:DNA cytosine methyltransferase [Streptomyces jeddahensis]OAH13404.1 modification methylase BspRI [Streptomyces jeddahensis]
MHTPRPLDPTLITVVDLFAGCGGFTQGFHEFRPEGAKDGGPVFHSIAAVEHNPAAAATYAVNFGSGRSDKTLPPAHIHVGDIEDWKPTPDALHADVVVGGPPCQGFSALNREKKGSDRNRLWEEYVRIVAAIRPKVFVIENVDRFLKSNEFRNLLSQVEKNGLLADYRLVDPPGHESIDTEEIRIKRYLLNAADYGAVQARRRAIVIGVRRDVDNGRTLAYPTRTHIRRPKRNTGIPTQPLHGLDVGTAYWRAVDSVFDESSRLAIRGTELPDSKDHILEVDAVVPGVFTTPDLHFGRNPAPLSIARYFAIPPGGNRKDLRNKWYTVDECGEVHIFDTPNPPGVRTPVKYLSTTSWDNHNTGTGDVMGRLRLGEPSVTIRTEFFKPEKGRYLHPTASRPITHYEAARIQGFPLDFRWCGSKTDIATQIGNAVPIPLGTAIASAIHAYLRD